MVETPQFNFAWQDLATSRDVSGNGGPDFSGYHKDIESFFAYWNSKRGGRRMPSRNDIDPMEIGHFLPGITLIEITPPPKSYIYRLVGTREVAMRGNDPTGKAVNEGFFGISAEESIYSYAYVAERGAPRLEQRRFLTPDGRAGHEQVIILPLSDDGVTVNKVIAYTHHLAA